MTFRQFLLSHNVDIKLFEQNCLPMYQCGDFGHTGVNDLFRNRPPSQWANCFSWSQSLQKDIRWPRLHDEWHEYIRNVPTASIQSGWSVKLFTRI